MCRDEKGGLKGKEKRGTEKDEQGKIYEMIAENRAPKREKSR